MMSETATVENEKIDQLESMLFKLIHLHDRYAQDHQLFNKEREEFIKFSELLADQIKEVGKLESSFQKNIQASIQTSINTVMEKLSESLRSQQAIKNSFEKTINNFETKFSEKNNNPSRFRNMKMMTITLIMSVVVSLFSVWFSLSKPTLPLTREQLNYLRDGQMLAKIWPSLSDSEKSHLKQIANKIS